MKVPEVLQIKYIFRAGHEGLGIRNCRLFVVFFIGATTAEAVTIAAKFNSGSRSRQLQFKLVLQK
jgi:predicted RNA-binding protein with TRAM domain